MLSIYKKREAGCAAFKPCDFSSVAHIKWKKPSKTAPHEAEDVTDPAELEIYAEATRAILNRYFYDTKTTFHHVFHPNTCVWQVCRKRDDAVGLLRSSIINFPPDGFNPADRDPEFPTDMIEIVMGRAELYGPHGDSGFWPFGPSLYQANGETRLNKFQDNGINPDLTKPLTSTEQRLLETLLNDIIRINLCNLRGHHSFHDLMQIIHDPKRDDEYAFRYVMHNFAMNYMRPGYNIQTNLAFCGPVLGLGKNYLADLLTTLIGENLVARPNNPTSTFNEWLENSTFVILDEIQNKNFDDSFNEFIKKCSINTYVPVEGKNKTQKSITNMANFWILSNSLMPYKTDMTDRRTIFIRTFHDSDATKENERKTFARDFVTEHKNDKTQALAHAMAKLCHMMDIDENLINTHRSTELGKMICRQSGSVFSKFLTDVRLADLITTPTDNRAYFKIRDLHNEYNDWRERNGYSKTAKANMTTDMTAISAITLDRNRYMVDKNALVAFRSGVPLDKSADDFTPSGNHHAVAQPVVTSHQPAHQPPRPKTLTLDDAIPASPEPKNTHITPDGPAMALIQSLKASRGIDAVPDAVKPLTPNPPLTHKQQQIADVLKKHREQGTTQYKNGGGA